MSEHGNLTKQLKQLIYEFVTPEGKISEQPTGQYYTRKQLGDSRIKLLRILADILVNTRFLKEPTKYYIGNRYMSIQGVAAQMKYIGKEISANTVQSIIWTDMMRFDAKLSKNILVDIVDYGKDLGVYEEKLLKTLSFYSNGHMFRNLALKLPEPIMRAEASDEQFQDFIYSIAPFTPHHMAYLSENISREMLGYANYLISTSLLSDEEQERKELLLELLSKEQA